MSITKRLLSFILSFFIVLTMSGCWNYRGLDQLNIVVGVAVDYDKDNKLFKLSYEVANLAEADKNSTIKGRLIESQGKTVFDAIRNTKRKEADKLFFGSTNVIVISKEVAQEIGVQGIADFFLRDGESRETVNIAISQEDTARKIIEQQGGDISGIVSADLQDILREDNGITASAFNVKLYELYSLLASTGRSAVLPVLHKAQNGDQETAELNGTAVLKGDKLIGFLTPEESKYLLFLEDRIEGGLLTLSVQSDDTDDITLEIFDNHTKKTFAKQQDKITIKIKTKTRVVVDENRSKLDMMDDKIIEEIKNVAEKNLETDIYNLIAKIQNEFKSDIFGFGEMIYKKDLKLWKELEPSWEDIFPMLDIEVDSEIIIRDSAFIK